MYLLRSSVDCVFCFVVGALCWRNGTRLEPALEAAELMPVVRLEHLRPFTERWTPEALTSNLLSQVKIQKHTYLVCTRYILQCVHLQTSNNTNKYVLRIYLYIPGIYITMFFTCNLPTVIRTTTKKLSLPYFEQFDTWWMHSKALMWRWARARTLELGTLVCFVSRCESCFIPEVVAQVSKRHGAGRANGRKSCR